VTLTLYNTLTRKKEPFRPIDPGNVRMYVCGPTVYDLAHIGNARPVIVFDVLFRLLRHIYGAGHVTYARNITDVDDKINARAAELYPGVPLNDAIRKLTEETARQFHEDIAALGVLQPTVEPRATGHIAEMRALCEALVAKGHAYVAQDHVLFDVSSMPDYGRLANRSLEEMEAGARVDVAPYKKGPMDFVLWKPSKPGEPAWPSPMGINAAGRPGWHIECSAMADRWLWQEPQMKGLLSEAGLKQPHVFDIHGGGIDLVFPHHENEIAQSRCAHGTPAMASVWMHNGFLQVEGEKMSKSLGNFVTIRDVLNNPIPALVPVGGEEGPASLLQLDWKERWNGLCARYAMLQTRYREPIDWTAHRFAEAGDELYGFYEQLRDANYDLNHPHRQISRSMLAALCDDLNTPAAIAALRSVAKSHDVSTLGASLDFLGLMDTEFVRRNDLLLFDRALSLSDRRKEEIGALVAARSAARKARDFKEADRIRDELSAMGIQLKDAKDPATGEIETTWEVKR
jgi:cysteinyl-tRNA synthetase